MINRVWEREKKVDMGVFIYLFKDIIIIGIIKKKRKNMETAIHLDIS